MTALEEVVRPLVAGIDTYLAGLPGQGPSRVRTALSRFAAGPVRPSGARLLRALSHLPAALSATGNDGQPELADLIGRAAPLLPWITYDRYPRAEIGQSFADGHAFVQLVGEGAIIEARDFDLGLFLIAPNTLYRDHHHAAPELYTPLTGPHGWRFGPDGPIEWKPAHEPVWNEPWAPHMTLTGNVPFLAIYGWTADVGISAKVIPASDWDVVERLKPPG